MQPDDLATARARVRQLLEFLKAFNEQRNPVIRRIEDYRQVAPRFWSTLPVASLYMDLAPLEDPQNGANVAANDPANGDEDDFVLRVTRPDLSAAPPPPPEVAPWVLDGWQDPGHDVASHALAIPPSVVISLPTSERPRCFSVGRTPATSGLRGIGTPTRRPRCSTGFGTSTRSSNAKASASN